MDPIRKGLLYRSEHRGIREMDVLMGGFARKYLPLLGSEELQAFEVLLDAPDQDLLNWCLGLESVPPKYDITLMKRLIDYAQPTS